MLFTSDVLERIASGRITCAFRRWRRPRVRVGTRMRTPVGLVQVDAVQVIEPEDLTDELARRAGFDSVQAALGDLGGRDGDLYRIDLSFAGADPRVALQERTDLSVDEVGELKKRLERYDRISPHGPWTGAVLGLIAERPGEPAARLAAALDSDTQRFKRNVRKLKELGLTISLDTGYRLSPRGQVLRQGLAARGDRLDR